MWIVQLALRRPYTFIVLALLVLIVGAADDPAHPGRHLPQHRHPGGERHLALYRPVLGGDGRPHGLVLRARDVGHGQRHRAHRVAEHQRRGRGEGVLPPHGEHPDRAGADRGHLSDHAGHVPARCESPAHPAVHRLDRADPAARAVQQDHGRARAQRHGQQLHAHPARDRAGRGAAVPLRRQGAPGDGGHRPQGAAGQEPRAAGRGGRARPAEPDPAHRHGQDRHARVRRRAQRQPEEHPGAQRSAGAHPARRAHDLHPRRGARARRLPAADQHRAPRRRARRAADHPQERQRLDARHRRPREGGAAAHAGGAAARAEDPDRARPVAVRARGRRTA